MSGAGGSTWYSGEQPAITSAIETVAGLRRRDDPAEIPGRDGHRHRLGRRDRTSPASNRAAPTRSTGSRTCCRHDLRSRNSWLRVQHRAAAGRLRPRVLVRARRRPGRDARAGHLPGDLHRRSERPRPPHTCSYCYFGNQPARVPAERTRVRTPVKQSGSRTSRPTRSASTPRSYAPPPASSAGLWVLKAKPATRRQGWTRRQSGRRQSRPELTAPRRTIVIVPFQTTVAASSVTVRYALTAARA